MSRVEVFRRDPEFPEESEELKHKPFGQLGKLVLLRGGNSKKKEPVVVYMMPRTAMTMAAAELVTKGLLDDV